MLLNNFNSYFEVLATLTIFYSGFEFFSTEVKNAFKFKKSNNLSNSINSILTALDGEKNPEVKEKLEENLVLHRIREEEIEAEEAKAEHFFESFKVLGVFVFLYCLSLIIIGGFQSESKSLVDRNYFFYVSSLLGLIVLIIGVFVYFYTEFFLEKNKPKYVVTAFLTILIICFAICTNNCRHSITAYFTEEALCFFCNVMKFITLLAPCSLYLLLFIKVVNHKNIFIKKFSEASQEYYEPVKVLSDVINKLGFKKNN